MERIRENREQGMDMKAAVNAAVDNCIRHSILADYLSRHKAEAKPLFPFLLPAHKNTQCPVRHNGLLIAIPVHLI